MKSFFVFLLLFISLFLQGAFVQLPLVWVSILLCGVVYKEIWIFPVAFAMGILLDILSFHMIGIMSVVFVTFLGIIFLYERKFEIQSMPFLVVFSFVSTLVYGLLFGSQYIFLQAIAMAGIAGGVFYLLLYASSRAIAKRLAL